MIWNNQRPLHLEVLPGLVGGFLALEALVSLTSLRTKRGDMEYAIELLLIVLNHPVIFTEIGKDPLI
jgi:hypothetical protein